MVTASRRESRENSRGILGKLIDRKASGSKMTVARHRIGSSRSEIPDKVESRESGHGVGNGGSFVRVSKTVGNDEVTTRTSSLPGH